MRESGGALEIRRLLSGGLITNYDCPSRCRHCLYACGPGRDASYMDEATAAANLSASRRLGCRSIHVGGGEPLLRPGRLARVLESARRAGVQVEYVETNCAWYRNPDQAVDLLSGLRGSGLGCLLISISPFHNEHIPYRKTRGVLEACQRAGIRAFPWVAGFASDLSALNPEVPHQLEEFEERFGKGYVARIPQRYWIHHGGRALTTFAPFMPSVETARLVEESGPCRELAETGHL